MSGVIDLEGITKHFGHVRALDGLHLNVAEGEVHGLLGPNGAGKSTAIRVMLGLLRADSGSAHVLGMNPWTAAPEARSRLAYVPGDVSLWPNLTGGEIIDVLARMHGGENRSRRDELIRRFELDPTRRSRTYSKGNRQKVGLVSALSVDAELLILDEPTSGLDPLMEQVFTECVAEAHRRRATVLLSSHILSEVEKLCDRVSVVRAGSVVDTGTLGELRGHEATVVIATVGSPPGSLHGIAGIEGLRIDGDRVRFSTTSFDGAMRALADLGIRTLEVSPPTLEDLFLHYYGHDREEVPA